VPTFTSVAESRMTAEVWCQSGIDRWAGMPKDPADYYALEYPEVNAWEWIGAAHSMDAAATHALLRQSVTDIAALLSASQEKTDLEAIAAGTADNAALRATWFANRKTLPNRKKVLVNGFATWFEDEDPNYLPALLMMFLAVQAKETGKNIATLEADLLILWRTRYDVNAFTAGGTYTA
jgi:hypothetical protein